MTQRNSLPSFLPLCKLSDVFQHTICHIQNKSLIGATIPSSTVDLELDVFCFFVVHFQYYNRVKHGRYVIMLCFLFFINSNSGLTTKNLTPEQRQQIINECVEEMISPTDLARKWNCNADTIRTWVRKAGLTLPKQYKKSIYPDNSSSPARAMGYDHQYHHLLRKEANCQPFQICSSLLTIFGRAGHIGHSLGGGGSNDGMNLTLGLTWHNHSWRPHALARQMTKP